MLLASRSRLNDGKAEALGLIESDYPPLTSAIKPKGDSERDQNLESSNLAVVQEYCPMQEHLLETSGSPTNSDKTGDFSLIRLITVFLSQANGSCRECPLKPNQESDTGQKSEVPDIFLGEG